MSRLRFFLAEAIEIASRDRGGALASLTVLTAVLLLLVVVLVAGLNVRDAARALEARKGLEVFLVDEVPQERIAELASAFRAFGEVSEVVFVSQEEALREIEGDLGVTDVAAALGGNPLSPSFRIRLTPQAASRSGVLAELAREIGAYEGVDEVLFGEEFVAGFERALRGAYFATAGAVLLAAGAVLLVLWNTMKLAFLARHDTIRILEVVGASAGSIRAPYVILGGLYALVGALLALGLAAGGRIAVEAVLPGIRFLPPAQTAVFLVASLLMGLLSSVASVEPALRGIERRHEAVVTG